MSKFFATLLMLVYNYFNSPTKLFLDLHLSKFLDNLTKLFRINIISISLCTLITSNIFNFKDKKIMKTSNIRFLLLENRIIKLIEHRKE